VVLTRQPKNDVFADAYRWRRRRDRLVESMSLVELAVCTPSVISYRQNHWTALWVIRTETFYSFQHALLLSVDSASSYTSSAPEGWE